MTPIAEPNSFEITPHGGWAGAARARLQAPPPAQRGALFRVASGFSRFLGRQGVPDVITVLHINPRLFWAWLFFASRLMPYGRLPARVREKIILRTAWNCRSRYEWGQHVDIALSVGVSDEEIVRMTRDAAQCPEAQDRALLLACDESCCDQCISDNTWALLAQEYDEKMLIEIMMLVGHYVMIAGFLNSSGLVLESPIEATLQAFYARAAALA